MPEKSLKHYSKYLSILEDFAASLNIKITYEDHGTEGIYIPSRNCIALDDQLSESAEIAILLHELGHAVDIIVSPLKEVKAWDKAFDRHENKKSSQADFDIVIMREERAWMYGRGIANHFNIRVGKWYDQTEKYCLGSYVAHVKS